MNYKEELEELKEKLDFLLAEIAATGEKVGGIHYEINNILQDQSLSDGGRNSSLKSILNDNAKKFNINMDSYVLKKDRPKVDLTRKKTSNTGINYKEELEELKEKLDFLLAEIAATGEKVGDIRYEITNILEDQSLSDGGRNSSLKSILNDNAKKFNINMDSYVLKKDRLKVDLTKKNIKQNTNTQNNNTSKDYSMYNNPYNTVNKYSFKFDKKPEDYLSDKNIENYLSDMVDKYYGDKNKEKEYNDAMKRLFKQGHWHKDEATGKETIDWYPGKENDLKIVQLELYEEKSDKLARAAAKEQVYPPTPEGMAEMQEDKRYIETKNYSYNRYETTKNNLVTLGKYGEKVNYLAVRTEPNVLKKIGHTIVNIPLAVRNVGAVVYRAVGKPVSRIYGRIASTNSGIYANKPAHRYEARKDYFVNKEVKRLQDAGLNPRPIRTLMLARVKALVKYKEGNAAVLEAGYQDIKKSYTEKAKANYFTDKLQALDKHLQDLEKAKKSLYSKNMTKAQIEEINEIEKAEKETQKIKQNILTNPRLKELIKDGKIKTSEVIQTDAISFNQHDRANKANVTRTITGIKVAGTVGLRFVGPKIEDWILGHSKIEENVIGEVAGPNPVPTKTPEPQTRWVESVVTTEEVPEYVTKISSQEKLLDQFSIKNIMNNSTDNGISYAYNNMGKNATVENMEFFRGAAQKINGKLVSLSDGNGFNSSKITSGVFSQEMLSNGNIAEDTNLFDILAALQQQAGNDVTAQDLVDKVLNCESLEEQQKMIAEMSEGLDFWKSRSNTGIANGWNSTQDEIQNILNNSGEALVDNVQIGTHTVEHVVKGHSEFINVPGEELNAVSENIINTPLIKEVTRLVDNPRIVKALDIAGEIAKGVTVMDAITMFFENLRDTKSNARENKEKPRQYNPQPASNKINFKGTSKKEDKKIYNTKKVKEEKDITSEILDIDDEISR